MSEESLRMQQRISESLDSYGYPPDSVSDLSEKAKLRLLSLLRKNPKEQWETSEKKLKKEGLI